MGNEVCQIGKFCISSDRAMTDETAVYEMLRSGAYWAKHLSFEAFQRALAHSAVVFGVFHGRRQVGFARIVSDCATFAYLTDVFIDEAYRGQGLSWRLMRAIMSHPELQGLRRFMLVTESAGGLYGKFGFKPLTDAEHWMEIFCSGD